MRPNSISCTCLVCGTVFPKKASAVARGGGKYCSRACQSQAKRHTVEDIWALIDQSGGPDACWPFTGYCKPKGYGAISFDGKVWETHRLVYVLMHGEPAPGLIVRHTCDNPPCCNPAHLINGTLADNMYDRRDRGRYATGEAHHNARLNEAKVLEIHRLRAEGLKQTDIAAAIGVSPALVNFVLTGRAWSHVKPT
jgi:hypothetical protein